MGYRLKILNRRIYEIIKIHKWNSYFSLKLELLSFKLNFELERDFYKLILNDWSTFVFFSYILTIIAEKKKINLLTFDSYPLRVDHRFLNFFRFLNSYDQMLFFALLFQYKILRSAAEVTTPLLAIYFTLKINT